MVSGNNCYNSVLLRLKLETKKKYILITIMLIEVIISKQTFLQNAYKSISQNPIVQSEFGIQ